MRNLILDIINLFDYIKSLDYRVPIPRITSSYQVRYEQFIFPKTSTVENFHIENEMLIVKSKYEREMLFSKITIALRNLNEVERQVFDLTFYKNVIEEDIMSTIHCCKNKVREIRKSACIKFLSSLGLDNQCMELGLMPA